MAISVQSVRIGRVLVDYRSQTVVTSVNVFIKDPSLGNAFLDNRLIIIETKKLKMCPALSSFSGAIPYLFSVFFESGDELSRRQQYICISSTTWP